VFPDRAFCAAGESLREVALATVGSYLRGSGGRKELAMTQARVGDFVWHDVLARDTEAAVAFYSDVVGWKAQPLAIAGASYTLLVGSEGPVCGAVPLATAPNSAGVPPHWTASVLVADVDGAADEAKRLGGRVVVPPADHPPIGRVAGIADPQGGSLHIYKPSQPAPQRDLHRPGAFGWSELATSDHGAAFDFYQRLFGWRKAREVDRPGGRYLVFANGDDDLGGMYTQPPGSGRTPAWLYYIRVADLDGSLARAQSRGAKLTSGPEAVPGGARVATLADPQGAAFALQAGG
jgi:predicted enzyme related to lactoylglutathione lyase